MEIFHGDYISNILKYNIITIRLELIPNKHCLCMAVINCCVLFSGVESPTFGHANENFSVFIDRIRNQFLKK